jgi:hypothetical protein
MRLSKPVVAWIAIVLALFLSPVLLLLIGTLGGVQPGGILS